MDNTNMTHNDCSQLERYSVEELIAELSTRSGIELSETGLHKPYDLIKKYEEANRHIEAMILIIR